MLVSDKPEPAQATLKKTRSRSERSQSATPPLSDTTLEMGSKMRSIRESKKVTRKTMSQKMGISVQQISRYEFGVSAITMDRLLQYANILDMPIMTFLPAEAVVKGTAFSKPLFDLWMEVESLPAKKRDQLVKVLHSMMDFVET